MLWRYAGEPASSYSLAKFTDNASVSDWASTAMSWAVEKGIITGVTGSTFVPKGTATRRTVRRDAHAVCGTVNLPHNSKSRSDNRCGIFARYAMANSGFS